MSNELSIKSEPRPIGFEWSHYSVTVPNGTTLNELLTPGYWAHHADRFKPRDLVEVLSEDTELDVQLRVIDTGVGYVAMRLCLKRHDYGKGKPAVTVETDEDKSPLPDVPEGYKIGWNVGSRTYYAQSNLVRPPEIVSEGHTSKREAIEAAIEHKAKVSQPLAA